jgi:predicted ABC-type ATPase
MACISVLAGTNGAGKSSIAGATLRQAGGHYYNPDEAARALLEASPSLSLEQANGLAWQQGKRLLEHAIRAQLDLAFETTLGGTTISKRLHDALTAGSEVRVWYAGLSSPELHLARVAERVARGGHSIPESDIRRRYTASRRNLIGLLPRLTELVLYDNSAEANPARGFTPLPQLVLHWKGAQIIGPSDLSLTPEWAKPIVAVAMAEVLG